MMDRPWSGQRSIVLSRNTLGCEVEGDVIIIEVPLQSRNSRRGNLGLPEEQFNTQKVEYCVAAKG